jgi:uncharacterized iron-regulated protein
MNRAELEDRFIGELVANYMSGEVPSDWNENYVKGDFVKSANNLAENLNLRMSNQDKQNFVNLLEEISKDEENEFFEKLAYEETITWCEDDKSWQMFQTLANYLINFFSREIGSLRQEYHNA